MTEKEVAIDLNELNIDIEKEIIFKSDLNKWIERKMDYYESIMEKTDGYNNVNAEGHLDMLIKLKEWLEKRWCGMSKRCKNCDAYNNKQKFCYIRWQIMDILEYCSEFRSKK